MNVFCAEADYWRGARENESGAEGLVIYAMDTTAPGEACRHIRPVPTSKEVASQIARHTAGTEGGVHSRGNLTLATCFCQPTFVLVCGVKGSSPISSSSK